MNEQDNYDTLKNSLVVTKSNRDSEIIRKEILEKKKEELSHDIPDYLRSLLNKKIISSFVVGIIVSLVVNVILGMGFLMDFNKLLLPIFSITIPTFLAGGIYSYFKETSRERRRVKNTNIPNINAEIEKHKVNIQKLEREIVRLQSHLYEIEKKQNTDAIIQRQRGMQEFQNYGDYNNDFRSRKR